MPKERRDRSVSIDRCRASPYPCSSRQSSPKVPSDLEENVREWEEARCPVCMDHPHNAVLLICASHEKGCRPYMCDTSYRHSNCLDQFRKSSTEIPSTPPPPQEETQVLTTISTPPLEEITSTELGSGVMGTQSPSEVTSTLVRASEVTSTPVRASDVTSAPVRASEVTTAEFQDGRSEDSQLTVPFENQAQPKLLCPLCRGDIKEWIVLEPARQFMNAKSRSCACESCTFSGSYTDLRKHARSEHPLVRPSEADPERQRSWRRLERQRDIGDLLSTIQSFGEERGEEGILPAIDDGGLLTVFFLIRVIRSGPSTRTISWSGAPRARAQVSIRRRSTRLWGESYDGEYRSSPTDEDNESSDGGSGPERRRRVRRRTTPDNHP